MDLPLELNIYLEKALNHVSLDKIQKAFDRISHCYRSSKNPNSFFSCHEDFLAYLVARFPATYGAIWRVLKELKQAKPELSLNSLLDLGAGPGTGLWATKALFPCLGHATLIEPSSNFISLGSELFASASFTPQPLWLQKKVQDFPCFDPHDLVLLSYVINELSQKDIEETVEKAWNAARVGLVIIEPGSYRGFHNILRTRDLLLSLGGSLLAPCPHHERCPLEGKEDWCHFSQRIARSSFHRKSKGAELCYEDEKFSYLIVMKEPQSRSSSRILSRPIKREGYIQFLLCSSRGIEKKIVTKRNRQKFKECKKLDWGDLFS